MAAPVDVKPEPVDEAALPSTETGEVDVPYSIYSTKEKWIIVGMVALAGFYRSVTMIVDGINLANHNRQSSASQHILPSYTNHSTRLSQVN